MIKYCLFIFTIFIAISCLEDDDTIKKESFIKLYGGSYSDEGLQVFQTDDNGYIIFGSKQNENQLSDIVLVKTDPYGDMEWEKTFGDTLDDYAGSIIRSSDNNYVIAGYSTNGTSDKTDIYVLKADNDGNIIWEKTFGNDFNHQGNGLTEAADGGYIIAGSVESSAGDKDRFLLKISVDGDSLRSKTYGTTGTEQIKKIIPAHSDGYILIGSSQNPGQSDNDINIIQINDNLNTVEEATFGESGGDNGQNIIAVEGGYVFIGTTNSYGSGGSDILVIKTGYSFYDIEWQNTFGGSSNEEGYSIIQNTDGSYTLTGSTNSYGNGGKDVYIANINSEGTLVLDNTFGSNAEEFGNCVIQTNDGGYAILGVTEYDENGMIMLIKTDADFSQ